MTRRLFKTQSRLVMAVQPSETDEAVALERVSGLVMLLATPKGCSQFLSALSEVLVDQSTLSNNLLPGRGVFASQPIPAKTIIEDDKFSTLYVVSCIIQTDKPLLTSDILSNWPYRDAASGKVGITQAIILGLGSMFNHSTYNQNVGWERDLRAESITYTALRDIQAKEELCISYGRIWFADSDLCQNSSDSDGVDDLNQIDIA
ncbi:hypothetical protein MMC24_007863 [Lignoscripta atroalba]|nr:hypothetical protein [Lignoscripta atroalba]